MSSTSHETKPVLIHAAKGDSHAQAVAAHLSSFGVKTYFWQNKQLLNESYLFWQGGASGFNCRLNLSDDEELDFTEVGGIWLRRPSLVKAPNMPSKWMECLSAWESQRALDGIYRQLSCLWVNEPAKQKEALLKLHQLKVAASSGLLIPDTLVTNEPDEVSNFYQKHNQQIVYKLIDGESFRYFPAYEQPRSIPSLSFRADDLKYLEQVKLSLHLFQQRIKKTHDLRLTVVGKKIFAAEIQSQWQGESLDWRLDRKAPCKAVTLDSELESKVLKLMQALGLNFGCLDFCVDSDGQSYFLEVNPQGQFLFLEERLGLPIAHELAKVLSGSEEPLIG
jgi:glutathione synthase/RimK-type ligase-like ATP-grasp enzyme